MFFGTRVPATNIIITRPTCRFVHDSYINYYLKNVRRRGKKVKKHIVLAYGHIMADRITRRRPSL